MKLKQVNPHFEKNNKALMKLFTTGDGVTLELWRKLSSGPLPVAVRAVKIHIEMLVASEKALAIWGMQP